MWPVWARLELVRSSLLPGRRAHRWVWLAVLAPALPVLLLLIAQQSLSAGAADRPGWTLVSAAWPEISPQIEGGLDHWPPSKWDDINSTIPIGRAPSRSLMRLW
jgi:hypothetical protein